MSWCLTYFSQGGFTGVLRPPGVLTPRSAHPTRSAHPLKSAHPSMSAYSLGVLTPRSTHIQECSPVPGVLIPHQECSYPGVITPPMSAHTQECANTQECSYPGVLTPRSAHISKSAHTLSSQKP